MTARSAPGPGNLLAAARQYRTRHGVWRADVRVAAIDDRLGGEEHHDVHPVAGLQESFLA